MIMFFLWQDMGPHIYQTCPSANYFDCKAMAIGARSQVSCMHMCIIQFILKTNKNTINNASSDNDAVLYIDL